MWEILAISLFSGFAGATIERLAALVVVLGSIITAALQAWGIWRTRKLELEVHRLHTRISQLLEEATK